MALPESTREQALKHVEDIYRTRMHDGRERALEAEDKPYPRERVRWAAYKKVLERSGLLPLGPRDVLDLGCQWGTWLAVCRTEWGQTTGRLCGVDLMPEWVDKGRRLYPYLDLMKGSGDRLPWDADSFDLVHQGMVFSSVLSADLREALAADMRRVVRPGGYVLWYDFFFNPKNPDTIGMTLRRVRDLFPGWTMAYRARETPAAPLSRLIERVWGGGVAVISALKALNFHHLILLNKPGG